MKAKVKSLVSLVLVIFICTFMFSGCNNSSKLSEELQSEKDAKLTFCRAGHDPDKADDVLNQAIKQYTEEYGKDVEIVVATYDNFNSKITSSITANDPIDTFEAAISDYPTFPSKGYTEALNDKIDLSDPNLDLDLMKNIFSYKGEYHGASTVVSAEPCIIFYNDSMFQDAGVEDPLEQYRAGKWTFDSFKDAAKRLTNESKEVWGFCSYVPELFLSSNKTSFLELTDEGTYKVRENLNPVKQSLEMMKSGWNDDKWSGYNGGDLVQSFEQGHNAMYADFRWVEATLRDDLDKGNMGFEFGIAPLPVGPNNKDNSHMIFANCFAMGKGTDCPKSAGKLIQTLVKFQKEGIEANLQKAGSDREEIFAECRKNPFSQTYLDGPIDQGKSVISDVTSGTEIDTSIDTYLSVFGTMADMQNQKIAKVQQKQG